MSWCTIESDPGVFTELIQTFGVKGVQVDELYMLDYDMLKQLKPVYGLIFLFKWQSEKDNRPVIEDLPENLFFASQKVNNACATQAILSILLNNADRISLGDELTNFLDVTKSFDADLRGDAIGQNEVMRVAHNSFARPEPFVMEEDTRTDKEDEAFHFISYVQVNGVLYELDGLKKGPVILDTCDGEDSFLQKVVPVIQERISRYENTEIKFNLLAVTGDPDDKYNTEIEELTKQLDGVDEETKKSINIRINDLKELKQQNADKKAKWRDENVRRRHNYVPFLVNLLKVLASKNELMPLVQAAKTKKQQASSAASGASMDHLLSTPVKYELDTSLSTQTYKTEKSSSESEGSASKHLFETENIQSNDILLTLKEDRLVAEAQYLKKKRARLKQKELELKSLNKDLNARNTKLRKVQDELILRAQKISDRERDFDNEIAEKIKSLQYQERLVRQMTEAIKTKKKQINEGIDLEPLFRQLELKEQEVLRVANSVEKKKKLVELELHELAKQKLDMEQLSLNVLNREETLQLRIRMLEETVATQEARIEYYVSKYIPDFGNSVPKEELDNQTSSSHNDILAKINSLQEWEQSLQMKEQQLSQEQQQVQALRNECNQELSQLEKEREDLKFVKRSIESHNEYMKHRMEEKLELLS